MTANTMSENLAASYDGNLFYSMGKASQKLGRSEAEIVKGREEKKSIDY